MDAVTLEIVRDLWNEWENESLERGMRELHETELNDEFYTDWMSK
jgi:hypothetical protein